MQSLQVSTSFQGPLILQALAVHLKDINPAKKSSYEFEDNMEPQGALILAVTAVCICRCYSAAKI